MAATVHSGGVTSPLHSLTLAGGEQTAHACAIA